MKLIRKKYDSEDEANLIIAKCQQFIGKDFDYENETWMLKKIFHKRLDNHFIIRCSLFIPPSKHFDIPFEELKMNID